MENEILEPKDYFENLKGKLSEAELQSIQEQLTTVAEQIERASKLGMKNSLHKLSFLYKTIEKEAILLGSGHNKFVYKQDILEFIKKVTPKNSVKIIELERYPRLIPQGPAEEIARMRDLEIFDEIFIVYTDFTNESTKTPEEEKLIARNKDPIAFGAFIHEKMGLKHDRFYFIADWEDEFCDLTFSKMIEKMADQGIKNPEKTISPDFSYVNQIVSDAFVEIEKETKRWEPVIKEKEPTLSILDKIKKWFR